MAHWQEALTTRFFRCTRGRGAFAQFEANAENYDAPFKHRLALLVAAEKLESTPFTTGLDERIANEGFGDITEKQLTLKCELVKQFLLREILLPPTITEPPLQHFNVIALLTVALKYYSPTHVSSNLATKKAKTSHPTENSPVKTNDRVPKEAVYQVELLRMLFSWCAPLPHLRITNEVDVLHQDQPKRSLDILYTNTRTDKKYAIELAASTTDDDLDAHTNRKYVVSSLFSILFCFFFRILNFSRQLRSWIECHRRVHHSLLPCDSKARTHEVSGRNQRACHPNRPRVAQQGREDLQDHPQRERARGCCSQQ